MAAALSHINFWNFWKAGPAPCRRDGIQARIMPSGSLASKAAFIRACISSSIFFCIGATSGRPMKARASSGVMSISIFTFMTAPFLRSARPTPFAGSEPFQG